MASAQVDADISVGVAWNWNDIMPITFTTRMDQGRFSFSRVSALAELLLFCLLRLQRVPVMKRLVAMATPREK